MPFQDADPNKVAKINAWAAAFFHDNLLRKPEGKPTLQYLSDRKISCESLRTWQLGLALNSRDALLRAAKAKAITLRDLAQAGLIVGYQNNTPTDKFVNRLMFPIADATGRIIGFGGRTLDGTGAKYVNSPTTVLFDKSNCLYGLDKARREIVSTGTAVLVEGYTDCIMAHQFVCKNVVATLGTSFTSGHALILRRYAKKVVLVFDSDAAGMEAANRALQVCLARPIDIKLASIPEGKDPCDFLLTAGKERFTQLVDEAPDVFEFKWNRLAKSFSDETTLIDRKAAVDEFLDALAAGAAAGNLPAIERGLIVNKLSNLVPMTRHEISSELSRRITRARRTPPGADHQDAQAVNLGQSLFAAAQRELIEVLLNEPGLFELARNKVRPDTFDVPILRHIAQIIFETLSAEPNTSLQAIFACAESVAAGRVMADLASDGEQKGNYRARLLAALDTIQRQQARMIKQQIEAVDDQRKFLRRLTEAAAKRNPHSRGML
jgi:DNA primase